MVRRSSALGLVALALCSAGCGQARTPAPDTTTPAAPRGTTQRTFPISGVSFTAPGTWTVTPGDGDTVATVSSATAVIGVFRYARPERLPRTGRELDEATDRLVEAAKARDTTFAETSRRTTRIDGQRALEVRGTGTVLSRPKTIRSLHVFGRGGEVVVDMLADPKDAARVDAAVFSPFVASLRIGRPRR